MIKPRRSLRENLFKNKFLFISTIIISILLACFNIGLAFILKWLVDISVDGTTSELIRLVQMVIGFLVLYLVLSITHYLLKNKYIKNALTRYKEVICQIIIRKDLTDFKKKNTGSYISVISNDVKTIETDYVQGNLILVTQIALFILGLAAMFYLNVLVAIVVLILSLVPIIVSVVFNGRVAFHQTGVSEKNEGFTTTIKDFFNGFTVVKSFGIEKEVSNAISDANQSLETKKRTFNNLTDLINSLTEVSGFMAVVGTFSFGAYLALNGKSTAGDVVAYIQLLNYLLGPIAIVAEYLPKRKAGLVLSDKIDQMLLTEEKEDKGEKKEEFADKIRFQDVSFSFKDSENQVLSDLNFELEKNKSYAVVGLSGSGKSTLLNLLMGYYDNYDGRILLDDTELREIDPSSLYQLISMIQQEIFMFDTQIENNIKLFKSYSDEHLQKAISMSGLEPLMEKKGPGFQCGENGSLLSGGEKQRVSIARALIKGTPILLLDEATSSLDNETSTAIEKSILNIEDITRVIVTHKLNGAMLARYDEIIMMKNGKVVEKGSFEELIDQKGFFHALYHVTH
ncbi:ABC transporter ATP-binding protein [Bacillus sp. SD088]|uniref:ABC transporter ATP-binding protein n=1 Tax=Bacillus sp. SD088 TaxID=2782012 RepID=UPI001A961AED|nr:ABC transporter ATP-binding protein [Bacillus sp. SD088]MBO0996116.1 ABC transporter ATP-binding protein [Bacillus sp. SD088]